MKDINSSLVLTEMNTLTTHVFTLLPTTIATLTFILAKYNYKNLSKVANLYIDLFFYNQTSQIESIIQEN